MGVEAANMLKVGVDLFKLGVDAVGGLKNIVVDCSDGLTKTQKNSLEIAQAKLEDLKFCSDFHNDEEALKKISEGSHCNASIDPEIFKLYMQGVFSRNSHANVYQRGDYERCLQKITQARKKMEMDFAKRRSCIELHDALGSQGLCVAYPHKNIERVYPTEGKLAAASARFEKCLEIEKSFDADSLYRGGYHRSIGDIYRSQGKLDEALREYGKSLDIFGRLAPDILDVADAHNSVGLVYQRKGDIDRALFHFHKALQIQENLDPDSRHVGHSYNNLGTVYRTQGKLEDALKHFRRALEIRQTLKNLDVVSCYNHLRAAKREADKDVFGILLSSWRSSLDVQLMVMLLSNPVTAVPVGVVRAALSIIEDISKALEQSNLKAGENVFEERLKEIEKDLSSACNALPNGLNIASFDDNLAKTLYKSQTKLQNAFNAFQKIVNETSECDLCKRKRILTGALSQIKKSLSIAGLSGTIQLDLGDSYYNIGSVYAAQKQYQDALGQYQEAIEIFEQLAPQSLDLASCYASKGDAYRALGKDGPAQEQYQKAAAIKKLLEAK